MASEVRVLLDTHAIIWLAIDRSRIPAAVETALGDAETVLISVVSAWEYGIQRLREGSDLPAPFAQLLGGIPAEPLALDFALHPYAEALPPIHADPFDRMLIAQALHHDLTLITKDRHIQRYSVPTLW